MSRSRSLLAAAAVSLRLILPPPPLSKAMDEDMLLTATLLRAQKSFFLHFSVALFLDNTFCLAISNP